MPPLLSLLMMLTAPVAVTSTPFPNDLTGPVGCAVFESGVILDGDKEFGGISAMRVEGDKIMLLSDDALAYSAKALRNEAGFITGLGDVTRLPLTDKDGRRLTKSEGDSEGLVPYGSGAIVSLERRHRIARFSISEKGWTEEFSVYEDNRKLLSENKGYEALAELKDGRLIAISEGKDDKGLSAVIFLTRAGDEWEKTETAYHAAPDFNVTEASIDPESGDLFVLERAFSRLKGPRARLVRVAAPDLFPGTVMEGDELFRLSALNGVDNMEGLQIERGKDGTLLAHIISDDNYNKVQQTVLIGFTIDEQKCSAPAITGDAP